jgi:hypothetical protein
MQGILSPLMQALWHCPALLLNFTQRLSQVFHLPYKKLAFGTGLLQMNERIEMH